MIDPDDKQVVRLESRFIETFKFRDGAVWGVFGKGSTFVMESTHVNNEIWLPHKLTSMSASSFSGNWFQLQHAIRTAIQNASM